MARARTLTLLPLDTWAEILGIDPRHFNQVTTDALPARSCSQLWIQYPWQEALQVSREDVAQAIAQAERAIARELHYRLLPTWEVDERHRIQAPAIVETINRGLRDSRNFPMSITTIEGQFISGGIETKTLITAGTLVTYTDEDGDGYAETATIAVTTTVTDPQEIAVFYPGEAGHNSWEIRPLNDPLTRRRSVTISGGVATVVMAREQLVDADLINALNPSDVDGNVDANFLASVDVYRRFNDPSQQAMLLWQPFGQNCGCGTATCPVCAHSIQDACLIAADFRRGSVRYQPSTFDAPTQTFSAATPAVGRNPDNIRLWYYAGLRDNRQDAPDLEMDDDWARAVTFMSLCFLIREVCGCDNVQSLAKRMREDLAANIGVDAGTISFQVTDEQLGNPFGTSRGQLFAWRMIRENVIGQAVIF